MVRVWAGFEVPEKLIIMMLNLLRAGLALIVPSMGIVWHLLSLEKVQANEWINSTHLEVARLGIG
jgi:hypothetical protein